jgi:hypothetical protein
MSQFTSTDYPSFCFKKSHFEKLERVTSTFTNFGVSSWDGAHLSKLTSGGINFSEAPMALPHFLSGF